MSIRRPLLRLLSAGLVLVALLVLASEPTGAIQAASLEPRPLRATNVPCGILSTDTTWTLAGSPYVLQPVTGYNSLTVAANVTLTIEPGVVVQAGSVSTGLIIEGHLEAVGTEAQPIVFTSQADSGPGEWLGLTFDGGTGNLRHTIVRHTGRRIYTCPGGVNSAAISVVNVQTGTVTLADSQVLNSAYYDNSDHGLCVKDSRVVVSDTLFSGIGDNASQLEYPIYIGGPTSEVRLSGLHLEGNIYNRVMLLEGALTGHDFTLAAQPEMEGYELYTGADGGDFVVPAGITMTVEPGVTVLNNWDINRTLVVRGHLEAVGTETQPILFSSHENSAPYQWKGLAFDGGTGTLSHTIVRYAGRGCYGCGAYDGAGIRAINVQAGEVRIEASQVMSITGSTSMTTQGLRVENSRVVVSDTRFSAIGDNVAQLDYPIYITGPSSDVSLTGLRLENNQYNRVLLDLGALTGHDFTLVAQPVMEAYEMYRGPDGGDFVVPVGITMTVEPGVTVLNNWDINRTLVVRGHLEAAGTETQPILFSSHDDSAPYQWQGLAFDGGTGNLRHAIVRYAGRGCYGCSAYDGAGILARGVLTGEVRIEASQVMGITGSTSMTNQGLRVEDSRVVVSDTIFSGIGDNAAQLDYPIYVSGPTSDVSFSGLRLEGNQYNRVMLDLGALTGHDFTLTAQPALEGYEFYNGTAGTDFIVPPGVTMTVEPGVKVMNNFDINQTLVIQGHLEAVGTEAQPIIFTSHADSAPYQWQGLAFDGGTGNLRYAIVRYAGRGSVGISGGAGIAATGVQTGTVRIENSQIRDISGGSTTANYGIFAVDSQLVVSETLITGISDAVGASPAALAASGSSEVLLTSSAIENNVRNGLLIEGAARVQITDTSILGNGGHGVLVNGNTAALTLFKSIVLANMGDGVRNSGNARVILGGAEGLGNTLLGNGGYGANQIGTSTQMTATHNWWGAVNGPYHVTLNPDGEGENVSNRVLFDPWAVDWQGDLPNGVYVSLVAPRQVVAGEEAVYVAMFVNGRTETVEDAVLMMVLPATGIFQEATHDGGYLAQQHAVIWKLGDLAPGDSGTMAARVQFAWGLPIDSEYAAQARLGGSNLPLSLPTPEWYQASTALELLGSSSLSAGELAAERAAYPDLDLIYTQAEADGFISGGAVRLELDGAAPITQVVMLRRTGREVLYLRRQGERVLAATFGASSYAVREADGGLALDIQAGGETFWGTWGNGEAASETGLAYSNCRYPTLPTLLLEDRFSKLAQALSSATCYPCLAGGSCTQCFAALQSAVSIPEAQGSLACAAEAGVGAAAEVGSAWWPWMPNLPPCPDGEYYALCTKSFWTKRWSVTYYPCVANMVTFKPSGGMPILGPRECPKYYSCVSGPAISGYWNKVGCQCKPVYTPPKPLIHGLVSEFNPFVANAATAQPAAEPQETQNETLSCGADEEGVSKCPLTKIRRPRDPNAKYGLAGDLVPGQLVTYTITYENEGDGRAYGVFVVDQLDAALDLSTLTVYGPGELIVENRTLLWTVGELGPKGAPDSQGVVSFTVALREDVPAGTAVLNQATVFFPTVGEETPTNAVLNVVQPLAAVPQRVETTYGQPVAITLAGRGPTGVTLSYQVLETPLNGSLSGTAPNLIYTPAANVTGLDAFTFKVQGGGQESRPAEVQIVIDPTGDTTAPQVRWTTPADQATDIPLSARAVLTDEVGPAFAPLPQVQFSEMVSETTLTAQAVALVEEGGRVVPLSVAYDGASQRAVLLPHAPLQSGTWYTATVMTSVTDLAGNPLAAATSWRFRTVQATVKVYLPLVMKEK